MDVDERLWSFYARLRRGHMFLIPSCELCDSAGNIAASSRSASAIRGNGSAWSSHLQEGSLLINMVSARSLAR
jgi:hypothetical protein